MAEQLVFLYIGTGYTAPTAAQINSLVNVNGVVLIPGNAAGPYNQKYIYGDTAHNETVTANAVSAVVSFVNNVWLNTTMSREGWGRLWIGTPMADGSTATQYNNRHLLYTTYRDYLDRVRTGLGNTLFYAQQFPGIYMNIESILPHATPVSLTDPLSNSTIKLFNDLSYLVRTTHGKQFLWCPYYGYGPNAANIIHNTGVVVNRMNLFNIVCLQPNYYFNAPAAPTHVPAPAANLTGVRQSVEKQMVCYRDGVPAAGGRLSTATLSRVGVVMEIDTNIYRDNPAYVSDDGRTPYEKWGAYASTYNPLESLNRHPFVFYASSTGSLFSDPYQASDPTGIVHWNSVKNEIRDFFA